MMSNEREDIVENEEGKDQESSTSASDLEKTLPNPFKEMEVVLRDLANDAMKIYPQIDKDTSLGYSLKRKIMQLRLQLEEQEVVQ